MEKIIHKPRILFLCTGNSARSQMAEAFMRKYGGDQFEVFSAGLKPKDIHPLVIQVMKEKGVSLIGQSSKPLTLYMGKLHFSYLITVCDNAEKECPIFPGMGTRLHWPFEDPAAFQGTSEEKITKFRSIRDGIEVKVKEWLSELEKLESGSI
jgi:arsenate reductase (thioredoxin)